MSVLAALEHRLRRFYKRRLRARLPRELDRQRLKLLWFGWHYLPLLTLRGLPLRARVGLLGRFLRIDWNVLVGHKPCEVLQVCRALAERPARPGEIMVEAGCWMGGSSAKFSLLCQRLGYGLSVYDSFEGVAATAATERQDSHDFSGEYAATQETVHRTLDRYGAVEVCTLHKGWFAQTLAGRPVPAPVRLAYIDCDLASGTREVLSSIVPALVADGWLFSQDFHLPPVRAMLGDPATWATLGRGTPRLVPGCGTLVSIHFHAETR